MVRSVHDGPRMKHITMFAAVLALAACGKKESEKSKPVTCAVAGTMVAKRVGELADEAKVAGDRRAKLDKDIAAAVSTRCTEDAWDELPLGCLGAVASLPDGKLAPATYYKAVDTCTKAIGDEKWKKMEDAIGVVIRSLKQ